MNKQNEKYKQTVTLHLADDFIINKSTVQELRKLKFNFPGVYLLSDKDSPIYSNKLYIGKSKNIIKRVSSHNVKLKYVTYIAFLNSPSQGIVDALEDTVIKLVNQQISNSESFKGVELINAEQVDKDIDILLPYSEYRVLEQYALAFVAQTLPMDIRKVKAMCLKHKKQSVNSLRDMINLGAVRGFAAPSIYNTSYYKLSDDYCIKTKDICQSEVLNQYYVFLGTKEIKSLTEKDYYKLNCDDNVKYIHVGSKKDIVINGSSKYNFSFLDIKLWNNQKFTEQDFISDTFEDFTKINDLDLFPYTLEEFLNI